MLTSKPMREAGTMPSLFEATGNQDIVDEWTFGLLQNTSVAKAALTRHRDTWITELHFCAIAAAGLNHVRLPASRHLPGVREKRIKAISQIGYLAFEISEGEPYIQGQLPYLHRAVSLGEEIWTESHRRLTWHVWLAKRRVQDISMCQSHNDYFRRIRQQWAGQV
jgi:hypothetical protein